jgi:hypothetical protein
MSPTAFAIVDRPCFDVARPLARLGGEVDTGVLPRAPHQPLRCSLVDAAKRQSDVRFALICHSNVKLALGSAGFCDLAQCRTLRSGEQVGHLRASHLLAKHPPLISPHGSPSQTVYSIAFEATLVGRCYVKLENSRVLTKAELNSLLQFEAGDDWWNLVKRAASMSKEAAARRGDMIASLVEMEASIAIVDRPLFTPLGPWRRSPARRQRRPGGSNHENCDAMQRCCRGRVAGGASGSSGAARRHGGE